MAIAAQVSIPIHVRTFRALRKLPSIPTVIVSLTIFLAVFANLVVPHPPTQIHLEKSRQAPAFIEGGEVKYILGADRLGRDILSRIIKGAQVSMMVVAVSVTLGAAVGTAIGLTAGFHGGWPDAFLMRIVDAMLAFPAILIALVFAVTLGPSFWVVVAVITLLLWAPFARLVRGQTLSWKGRDFVNLAKVAGCSNLRIILVHILPNVRDSIVVLATLQVGWVILIEGTLSFLGAGIPAPTPTWGSMVADGRELIRSAWWMSMFPGVAIFAVVLSFNLLGDWLRDTLDPRLRQL